MSVPRPLRWEIWGRGTRRFARREPYAALLIVRHALHLHRAHREDPAWSETLDGWRELAAELAAATGVDESTVERDYRWIDLTDRLSLAACNRWREGFSARGFDAELRVGSDRDGLAGNSPSRRGADAGSPRRGADAELVIDPFPLAGASTLSVACRLIPDRAYAGDADLGVELAAARWRHYTVRVAAPGAM